jgi:hypothetical protein
MAGKLTRENRTIRRSVVRVISGLNWIRILSNGGEDKEIEENVTKIYIESWRYIKLELDHIGSKSFPMAGEITR